MKYLIITIALLTSSCASRMDAGSGPQRVSAGQADTTTTELPPPTTEWVDHKGPERLISFTETTTTTTTAPPPPPETTTTTVAPPPPPPRPAPVVTPTTAPPPPPAPSVSGSGGCGGDLPPCYVMQRESGGNPHVWNGGCTAPSGYSGAKSPCGVSSASGKWQFVRGTWNGYGGYKNAADAPEHVQDAKARELWANGRGCGHWAAC